MRRWRLRHTATVSFLFREYRFAVIPVHAVVAFELLNYPHFELRIVFLCIGRPSCFGNGRAAWKCHVFNMFRSMNVFCLNISLNAQNVSGFFGRECRRRWFCLAASIPPCSPRHHRSVGLPPAFQNFVPADNVFAFGFYEFFNPFDEP